jgi:hypothetical protein
MFPTPWRRSSSRTWKRSIKQAAHVLMETPKMTDESDASGTSAMGTAERTDGGTTSGEAPTIVPVKDGKDVQHLSEASPIEWIDILENADNASVFGLRAYNHTREPAELTGRVKCADKTW